MNPLFVKLSSSAIQRSWQEGQKPFSTSSPVVSSDTSERYAHLLCSAVPQWGQCRPYSSPPPFVATPTTGSMQMGHSGSWTTFTSQLPSSAINRGPPITVTLLLHFYSVSPSVHGNIGGQPVVCEQLAQNGVPVLGKGSIRVVRSHRGLCVQQTSQRADSEIVVVSLRSLVLVDELHDVAQNA